MAWFNFSSKKQTSPLNVQLRPSDGQGPYTALFKTFIPRKVAADFYEFLREAIPVIDAAIGRLVALDGHLVVMGDDQALVDEIQDWLYNVPVNDLQKGLQAFHQNLSNEAFEQGFGLGEFITDRKRTDIVGLRVADSKSIKFRRENAAGGVEILQRADNDTDYRPLNPGNLIYFSVGNENQNPYGTPVFRSCEFVAQILATMHNSLLNVWERFGDPSFSVVYKTSKRDGTDLESRRKKISDDLDAALRAKRKGHSADFVTAIDTNSEMEIKIIGADGKELTFETPSRHVLEQIVAKSGLPPWMLGLHWSTTERLAAFESEMLLADVSTRQAAKLPHFYNLVRTMLLLRGRTWKKGAWWLEWGQVNLHDVVAQAQARFLNAQADMYYLQNAAAAGITLDVRDLALGKSASVDSIKTIAPALHIHGPGCGCKTSGQKEIQRTFNWPALDKVEDGFEARLKSDWAGLRERVATALGLDGKGAKAPGDAFAFSIEQRARVMDALRQYIGQYDLSAEDSPIRYYYGQAYSLGLIQGANMVGADRPILDIIRNRESFEALANDGFSLVKNNATRAITNKILPEMEAFMLAGSNPVEASRRLEKLFGDQNADWERLARSEMSMAAESAKLDEWEKRNVKQVEFSPAPDACAICMALAGDYAIGKCPLPVKDTHPRCRCSTRPAKSET